MTDSKSKFKSFPLLSGILVRLVSFLKSDIVIAFSPSDTLFPNAQPLKHSETSNINVNSFFMIAVTSLRFSNSVSPLYSINLKDGRYFLTP